MKYIIDEEELKDLVSGYYTFSGQPVYKWVNDFLKSKTPVEEIADGKIVIEGMYPHEKFLLWDKQRDILIRIIDLFKWHTKKNIRIYIEEAK